MEFRVEVLLSGLILYVRETSSGPITHALLRQSPDSGTMAHHPLLDVGTAVALLQRNYVQFQFLDGAGKVLGHQGGATPHAPDPVGPLPNGDEDSFGWVPEMAAVVGTAGVERRFSQLTKVPSEVVAHVAMTGGELRSSQLAWAGEKVTKGGKQVIDKWIPALEFKESHGAQIQLKRACAEEVRWSMTPPNGAKKFRVVLRDLHDTNEQPDNPVPLREVEVEADVVERYSLTNSPPVSSGNPPHLPGGRKKGAPAPHFKMLYDFLKYVQPGHEKRMPHIPKARPAASGTGSSRDAEGIRRLLGRTGIRSIENRPICVPGVGEPAP